MEKPENLKTEDKWIDYEKSGLRIKEVIAFSTLVK
jgi:hypothetical protein